MQPVEHGIQVEGVVQVRILYSISDDEMPFYSMETMIPFSQMIEGEQVNGQCGYQLQADLEQLSMVMLDSSEIEVKVVLNLNTLLVTQWRRTSYRRSRRRNPIKRNWRKCRASCVMWYSHRIRCGYCKNVLYHDG